MTKNFSKPFVLVKITKRISENGLLAQLYYTTKLHNEVEYDQYIDRK